MGGVRSELVLAVRFLTVVPVPGREAAGPGALGRAAWWFPLVGLALGVVLALADRGFARVFPPLLAAVLVVAGWKLLTGGIHLDGLADCLDGLAGRDAGHRLAIMRDSRIGVFGALGLLVSLLLAVAAVAELPASARGPVLVLAPAAGRAMPALAGMLFRAVTPHAGAGADFLSGLPRAAGATHLLAGMALGAALLGMPGALVALGGALVGLAGTALLARRIGGVTGDVLGAGVELSELGVLLAASAAARLGAM
ncbi:MAG TPA: adenosylcobinamide-GDP ribazoletransferase [Methylomirabilota bacterium]|nr:adenosylcobinamide-GDP ribazoletransferase [Methylomirabilota bacterium]